MFSNTRVDGRLIVLSLLVAAVGLSSPTVRAQQASSAPHVAAEVLVEFKPGVNDAQRAAVRSAFGARASRRYDELLAERWTISASANPVAVARAVAAHPAVAAAQPNFLRRTTASAPLNDLYWVAGYLWGLEKINAAAAWNNFGGGADTIVVADIDTGVDYTHPDLAANMWRNTDEGPANGIYDYWNGWIDDL